MKPNVTPSNQQFEHKSSMNHTKPGYKRWSIKQGVVATKIVVFPQSMKPQRTVAALVGCRNLVFNVFPFVTILRSTLLVLIGVDDWSHLDCNHLIWTGIRLFCYTHSLCERRGVVSAIYWWWLTSIQCWKERIGVQFRKDCVYGDPNVCLPHTKVANKYRGCRDTGEKASSDCKGCNSLNESCSPWKSLSPFFQ